MQPTTTTLSRFAPLALSFFAQWHCVPQSVNNPSTRQDAGMDVSQPIDRPTPTDVPTLDMATDTGTVSRQDVARDQFVEETSVPANYRWELGRYRIPCKFPAAFYAEPTRVLGLCTAGGSQAGDRPHLFELNEATPETVRILSELNTTLIPHSFIPVGENHLVVSTATGLVVVDRNTRLSTPISFPTGYNTGGGLAYDATTNRLAVATAQLDFPNYGRGAILIYTFRDGTLTHSESDVLHTTDLNPTGLHLRADGTLVVINSGDFSPTARASLDFFNLRATSLSPQVPTNLPLNTTPGLTAQVSGQILVRDDIAYIGTAGSGGRFFRVNLGTPRTVTHSVSLTGTNFHSGMSFVDGYPVVADFNSNRVLRLSPTDLHLLQTLTVTIGTTNPGEYLLGPSTAVMTSVLQTTGIPAATGTGYQTIMVRQE